MKTPFITLEKAREITKQFPTPFHIYDEKGIIENLERLKAAFSWNKGFREYFAVKANANPALMKILREYGCGADCSSMTELMLSEVAERIHALNIKITFAPDVKTLLAKEGFDPTYGARPLRRAVVRLVEDAISGEMLEGRIKAGDSILASVRDEKIVFEKE